MTTVAMIKENGRRTLQRDRQRGRSRRQHLRWRRKFTGLYSTRAAAFVFCLHLIRTEALPSCQQSTALLLLQLQLEGKKKETKTINKKMFQLFSNTLHL